MLEEIITEAPGRINIIGEHTDYNDGYVFPAAIDRVVRQKIKRNSSPSQCILYSEHYKQSFKFDLRNIQSSEYSWANYLLGIAAELGKIQITYLDLIALSEEIFP